MEPEVIKAGEYAYLNKKGITNKKVFIVSLLKDRDEDRVMISGWIHKTDTVPSSWLSKEKVK